MAAKRLRDLLQTETGLRAARALVRKELRRHVLDGGFERSLSRRHGDDPGGAADELVQDFLLFVFDEFLPALPAHPDFVAALLQGRGETVLRMAVRRFFWRRQDAFRTKEADPRAYLHRRIRDIVTGGDAFVTRKQGGNLFFTLADLAERMDGGASFPPRQYAGWPPPASLDGAADRVFSARYLAEAAGFFCREAVQRDIYAWVPVREVVRYLATHIPGLDRPKLRVLSENDARVDSALSPEKNTPS